MRLVISIDMDNSAFDPKPHTVSVRGMVEVARILRVIPQKLRNYGWTINEPNGIRDANGTTVGYWTVVEKSAGTSAGFFTVHPDGQT